MSSKVSRIYPHRKTRGEIKNEKEQSKRIRHRPHLLCKTDGDGNIIPVYDFETW